MSKKTHTFGPWTAHQGLDYIVVLRPDDSTESGIQVDNIEDARLIAAAPLLHKALKNLLDASSLGGTDPQRRRDAKRDAIDALRAVDGA